MGLMHLLRQVDTDDGMGRLHSLSQVGSRARRSSGEWGLLPEVLWAAGWAAWRPAGDDGYLWMPRISFDSRSSRLGYSRADPLLSQMESFPDSEGMVLVMGVTGAGKSTFVNTLKPDSVKVTEGLGSSAYPPSVSESARH